MQTTDEIIKYLRENLSKKRFAHTMGVAKTSQSLAEVWGADSASSFLAGLVHDCAKELPYDEVIKKLMQHGYTPDETELNSPGLLHAPCGAILASELFGIEDRDVLNAVKFHTVGRPDMSLLEKIVYVADFIEPGRSYSEADVLRRIAFENLDRAVLREADMVIEFTIERGKEVHPATVITRNHYLKMTKEGKFDEK